MPFCRVVGISTKRMTTELRVRDLRYSSTNILSNARWNSGSDGIVYLFLKKKVVPQEAIHALIKVAF